MITFLQRAVIMGIPLLFGSTGETITEKSGHLNLGIPGVMYMGGICAVIGAFFYENAVGPENIVPFLAILIPLACALLGSLLMGLVYSFFTVTLRANQNVTGLALTTFGVGFGNFFGGSLIKLADADVPSINLTATSSVFKTKLPYDALLNAMSAANAPSWLTAFVRGFCDLFLSYSFLAYAAIIIAFATAYILKRTRVGLHLRAVGENPGTADAAGINVGRYKYVSTCLGSMIAGLGGLYYIMDYAFGVWSNNGFGDRGWLAIALVIFTVWKPNVGIIGSFLFGGLLIIHNYIPGLGVADQELIKALPYVVTVIVLIFVSAREKKESLPPQSLGLSYFREER